MEAQESVQYPQYQHKSTEAFWKALCMILIGILVASLSHYLVMGRYIVTRDDLNNELQPVKSQINIMQSDINNVNRAMGRIEGNIDANVRPN